MGLLSHAIEVRSNSIENSQVWLWCRAYIEGVFEVLPGDRVRFGQVTREQGAVEEVTIRTEDGSRFTIEAMEAASEFFDAELTRAPGEESLYRLKIAISPTAPQRNFRGLIRLRTDRPDKPSFDIYVYGKVVPASG